MSLADALIGQGEQVVLHFPDEAEEVSLGKTWQRGKAVASWGGGPGEPVAIALANTWSCVAVLLGAIRSGLEVVSIPTPPRGVDVAWYASFVRQACLQRSATRLVVDARYLPLLPDLPGISYTSFEEVLATRGAGPYDPFAFRLVQFTSGSSSDPKGVVLTQSQILENVFAILERLELQSGDGSCTWLPLSHDMGLVGMFLAAVVGSSSLTGGANVVVMTPESFLANPNRWLTACSEYGSTITASPNFALEMATRRPSTSGLDLSSLRVCITGAEPVNGMALERFTETFAGSGFTNLAHCPAYGLAEATLAVSMTRPGAAWTSTTVDPEELANGNVEPSRVGTRIVGAGSALAGVEVRIDSEKSRVGEILISSKSLLECYSDGSMPIEDGGWLRTADLGFIENDELYVVGRADDVLFSGGQKVFAFDIERYVGELSGVRMGRVIALMSNNETLSVLVEADGAETLGEEAVRDIAVRIQHGVSARTGIAPSLVGVVARGRLPMTASGKVRRRTAQLALEADSLDLLSGSIAAR